MTDPASIEPDGMRADPAPIRSQTGAVGSADSGTGTADSAGESWTGRVLAPTGFEGDDGTSDPAVLAALSADDATLMRTIAAARFVVAVVAQLGEAEPGDDESGENESGEKPPGEKPPGENQPGEKQEYGVGAPRLAADKNVDMALITLTAPDGTRALPAFTGLGELAAYDRAARPVPVTAARLGQAAIAESCDVIIVNLGGEHPRELRPSQVWALAQQREWLAPDADPFVAAAVTAAARAEPVIQEVAVYAGEPARRGVLGVEVRLTPGLGAEQVEAVVTRLGERLATDGEFRARIDGLTFRLR